MDSKQRSGNYGHRKGWEKSHRPKLTYPGDHPMAKNGNAYSIDWSSHSLSSQPRLFPNDPSYSTFPSYHVSYPVESYPSLSVYPPLYSTAVTPPQLYPTPPTRKNRRRDIRRTESGGQLRLSQQEYASLPPVNCDGCSEKSSDSDSHSKRHYSDPGIGPPSSDASLESCKSPVNPMYVNLAEEIQDLKDNRKQMAAELSALLDELNELKMKTCSHCLVSEYQPGSFTDAIKDFRKAAQLSESSILAQLDKNIDTSTSQLRKILEETTDRLSALESKLALWEVDRERAKSNENATNLDEKTVDRTDSATPISEKLAETSVPDAFRMLHSLDQQKRQLEEDLKEALAGRNEAEANTQKLERLVAILRTKIKGLSTDTSLADENLGFGGGNTIDSNPFIIMDTLVKTPSKCSSEHNLNENNYKCTEVKMVKSPGSPTIPMNTKLGSSAQNPSLPAKPIFSHLPKPVLGTLPKLVNGVNRSGEGKLNDQVTKFVVGKTVSAPSQTGKLFSDSSTDSSVDDHTVTVPHLPTALPASITITGPVTDF